MLKLFVTEKTCIKLWQTCISFYFSIYRKVCCNLLTAQLQRAAAVYEMADYNCTVAVQKSRSWAGYDSDQQLRYSVKVFISWRVERYVLRLQFCQFFIGACRALHASTVEVNHVRFHCLRVQYNRNGTTGMRLQRHMGHPNMRCVGGPRASAWCRMPK
jgi:hypothetical protein